MALLQETRCTDLARPRVDSLVEKAHLVHVVERTGVCNGCCLHRVTTTISAADPLNLNKAASILGPDLLQNRPVEVKVVLHV